jgi:hypothetical protein
VYWRKTRAVVGSGRRPKIKEVQSSEIEIWYLESVVEAAPDSSSVGFSLWSDYTQSLSTRFHIL